MTDFYRVLGETKTAKLTSSEGQDNHSSRYTTKSLVPATLEHGDQRPQLNTKTIPLSSATPVTTIHPEITLVFEIYSR
jgi:hypothetical protein